MRPGEPSGDNLQNIDTKKSIVLSSRIVNVSGLEDIEEGEETEIAAQISVPQEGGWGWVVVLASFCSAFILDGTAFTYGSIFNDITIDLEAPESAVALVNSVSMAMYFMASPVASACINRFGFRACAMTGSIICSFGMFWSYFATSISMLCVSYGVMTGMGFSFINMSVCLVVGFYFERIRALALSIATTGSSAGIMIMFPLNAYLVSVAGWRIVTLLHAGLFGFVYYISMVYRPLLSLTVINAKDDAVRTVTYLPSLASTAARTSPSRIKIEALTPTATERLFSAVSNVHFPTAEEVVEEGVTTPTNQPGPSTAPVSKLTLTAYPHGALGHMQLEQVKSIMSKLSIQVKAKTVEVAEHSKRSKKRSCWKSLCHWDKHVEESRPMYRDDAFYDGRVDKLPIYQKSMMDTAVDERTGLEYQMAVTRALTTRDLRDNRGVFTTAVRRILVTMMDPKLLGKNSFRCICMSGFLTFVGFTVPYVFIQDRNMSVGVDPIHCDLFVSVIGLMNVVGKIVIGALAVKLNPLKLYYWSCIIPGLATMASNLCYNPYYQYAYCAIYGFFVATLACLRSVIIANLYGLENLTNATGMMLLFQGLGSLISTPMAILLKGRYGYSIAFHMAGVALILSGIVLIPVSALRQKETAKENIKNASKNNPAPTNVQKSK